MEEKKNDDQIDNKDRTKRKSMSYRHLMINIANVSRVYDLMKIFILIHYSLFP